MSEPTPDTSHEPLTQAQCQGSLQWSPIEPASSILKADTPTLQYRVAAFGWSIFKGDALQFHSACDSAEAGKAAAEEHWRGELGKAMEQVEAQDR